MKVGFTGTRQGMSQAQKDTLTAWLSRNRVYQFHHGSAIGADEEAVRILLDLTPVFDHIASAEIHAHPADVPQQGSAAAFILSHKKHPVAKPLARNHHIVDACELLLACPATAAEERRSGTWSTVRYARQQGKRVVIFWPDGTVTEEKGTA